MNYSLLLGIETLGKLSSLIDSDNLSSRSTHCFKSGNSIYHVAIIDYLQVWDFNKKFERYVGWLSHVEAVARASALTQTY